MGGEGLWDRLWMGRLPRREWGIPHESPAANRELSRAEERRDVALQLTGRPCVTKHAPLPARCSPCSGGIAASRIQDRAQLCPASCRTRAQDSVSAPLAHGAVSWDWVSCTSVLKDPYIWSWSS